MDHFPAKANPEPINTRIATRSRVANLFLSYSTQAATFPLPLFRQSWGSIFVVNFHEAHTRSVVMPRSKKATHEGLIDK
jgi:hypothetical protein